MQACDQFFARHAKISTGNHELQLTWLARTSLLGLAAIVALENIDAAFKHDEEINRTLPALEHERARGCEDCRKIGSRWLHQRL